jgi:hypothetical protein
VSDRPFRRIRFAWLAAVIVAAGLLLPGFVRAEGDDAEALAKKLQNPIANLISVPLQSNWDWGIGRFGTDAMRYTLNVQPVIPISLGKDWNLITRTIVPFIHAESPIAGGDPAGGIGDILQSFFLSPAAPLGGFILGGGPVFLYPSASNDAIGSEKWGAGPTVVALRQDRGFTYGIVANHVWSFAGNAKRQDLSSTFMQPFLSYTTRTSTTFGVNTESAYDWENSRWTVPINATVAQLVKLGPLPIQLQLGYRYYAERPIGGPGWGIRFTFTFLFPK